ncbi:ATP-binding cassette domain-containing protein [Salipaludibacillus sp. HK11]|uniref:ATP-binding cassette domain-containing protein n=1 Tax=Salipaludibacillus sp. HK11 TaxID=3394320 RepID=UPI0039FDAEFB
MTVISCDNLTKTFGGKRAVENVSLHIEENTITGVIGRNAAGKTTLLQMIAGLKRPKSGTLTVFGEQPFNNLFVSYNSIFIDDNMCFPSVMNLAEIIQTAESFYPNWDQEIARRLLSYFSFDLTNRHGDLSKGKISTFHAVIGLASRCPLTIFDEPTTGMDESARRDFYKALLKDYLEVPRTILISSHHLSEIEDLLENLLLIDQGKVHLHQSIDEMKQYALRVTGDVSVIDELVKEKSVLHEESSIPNHRTIIIRNDSTEQEQAEWITRGLDVTFATPGEVCVYVTKQENGGIDDVYRRT